MKHERNNNPVVQEYTDIEQISRHVQASVVNLADFLHQRKRIWTLYVDGGFVAKTIKYSFKVDTDIQIHSGTHQSYSADVKQ